MHCNVPMVFLIYMLILEPWEYVYAYLYYCVSWLFCLAVTNENMGLCLYMSSYNCMSWLCCLAVLLS